MFVDKLRIQKLKPLPPQPRNQMHQHDLAGIDGGGKHALAEKSTAESNPVKSPNQFPAFPCFNAMSKALMMERGIESNNFVINPCIGTGRSATTYHRLKIHIESNLVYPFPDRTLQTLRDMKSGDWQNATHIRIVPPNFRTLPIRSHRKKSCPICLQYHVRRKSRH
ncbi:MAG: hypothetical protein KAI76_05300 [Alphaproteobacteria bacterium]|nr:hypothetical protein [Alphaproteobacteria bacterium]